MRPPGERRTIDGVARATVAHQRDPSVIGSTIDPDSGNRAISGAWP